MAQSTSEPAGGASASRSARTVPATGPAARRRPVPTQGVRLGRRVRVRGARVSWRRVRGAGGSVTRLGVRRAPSGAGGAHRQGRSGAVRRAAPPGLGRPRPAARPGSMDRSSLLQLIQEQVRGGGGRHRPPAVLPLRRRAGGGTGLPDSPARHPPPKPPLRVPLAPMPELPRRAER